MSEAMMKMSRFSLTASLLVWCCLTGTPVSSAPVHKFAFGEVSQALGDRFDSPGSVYKVEIIGKHRTVQTLMNYPLLAPIAGARNLERPQELTGVAFDAPVDDPFAALKHLASESYRWSQQALYRKAAESLARLEAPSFDGFNPRLVGQVFKDAFKEGDSWFEKFQLAVIEQSQGKVGFSVDDKPKVQAPGPARYFIVSDGAKSMHVVFGPFDDPFRCSM